MTFLKSKSVGIIGASFSGGQVCILIDLNDCKPRGGVDMGPAELIKAGLVAQITQLGWKADCTEAMQDFTTLVPLTTKDYGVIKNAEYVSLVCESVYKSVSRHCAAGHLALTLGYLL